MARINSSGQMAMSLLRKVTLIVTVAVTSSCTPPEADLVWIEACEIDDLANHWYGVSTAQLNGQDARDFCEGIGARLVSADTYERDACLRSVLERTRVGDEIVESLLGAHYRDRDSLWRWSNGQIMESLDDYHNCHSLDQNGICDSRSGSNACLQAVLDKDEYHWETIECTVPSAFVCEYQCTNEPNDKPPSRVAFALGPSNDYGYQSPVEFGYSLADGVGSYDKFPRIYWYEFTGLSSDENLSDVKFSLVNNFTSPYEGSLPMMTYNEEMDALEIAGDMWMNGNLNHGFLDVHGHWTPVIENNFVDGRWGAGMVYSKEVGTLFVGGYDFTQGGHLDTVKQLYSPKSWKGQFAHFPPLNQARGYYDNPKIWNQKIYVAAGFYGLCSTSIDVLDISGVHGPADTTLLRWKALTPLKTPRDGITFQVHNGLLWAAGGKAGNFAHHRSLEIYDLARETSTISVQALSSMHDWAGSIMANENTMLVYGGDLSSISGVEIGKATGNFTIVDSTGIEKDVLNHFINYVNF